VPTGAGGTVDAALSDFYQQFQEYMPYGAPPVPAERYRTARALSWSSVPWESDFRNTASYPPVFYLPQIAALWVGRHAGLSILDSYYLARGAALVATFLIALWALRLAGRARPLLRVVMFLPMTLFLGVSISQDGQMIAAACLLAAILSRPEPLEPKLFVVAALCVAFLAAARPPYAALALLLFLPSLRGGRWWPVLTALLSVVSAVAVWMWISAPVRIDQGYSGTDRVTGAAAQLHWLMQEPIRLWQVGAATLGSSDLRQSYLESFIGNLGWLNLSLSPWAYHCAEAALLVAGAACCFGAGRFRWTEAALSAVAWTGAVIAIFLALYMVWSAVGAPAVEGVQGRYFLPLASLVSLSLPVLASARRVVGVLEGMAFLILLPAIGDMTHVLHHHYLPGS
jgi:uncharacterized membrane protein